MKFTSQIFVALLFLVVSAACGDGSIQARSQESQKGGGPPPDTFAATLASARRSHDLGDHQGCLSQLEALITGLVSGQGSAASSDALLPALKLKAGSLAALGDFSGLDSLVDSTSHWAADGCLDGFIADGVLLEAANLQYQTGRFLGARARYELLDRKGLLSPADEGFVRGRLEKIAGHHSGDVTGRVATRDGSPIPATVTIENGFFSEDIMTGKDGSFVAPVYQVTRGNSFYLVIRSPGFAAWARCLESPGPVPVALGEIALDHLESLKDGPCAEAVVLCFSTQEGGMDNPAFGIHQSLGNQTVVLDGPDGPISLKEDFSGVYSIRAHPGAWDLVVNHKGKGVMQLTENRTTLVAVPLGTMMVD